MALHRSTDQHEEFELDIPADEAFIKALHAYEMIGKIKSTQQTFRRIDGKIWFFGLNVSFANVTVQVSKVSDEKCKLVIDATAQEGLVDLNTVNKAVSKFLEAFN